MYLLVKSKVQEWEGWCNTKRNKEVPPKLLVATVAESWDHKDHKAAETGQSTQD